MKFITLLILVLSFSVQAQSLRSLGDVMSDLGNSFKVVTLGLRAGVITPTMFNEAVNIQKYIIESEGIIPNSILSLPNIEQAAAK
jgi:hypothetical protein